MNARPLVYQDQDSLNSAQIIVANAEKAALISFEEPRLAEERRVESTAPAVWAGVACGLFTLGFLIGVASGAAGAGGMAMTSGSGLVTGLSAVGKLIGGIVINSMVSGILLLIGLPLLIGVCVWLLLRGKLRRDQAARFLADKDALHERALRCREEISGKLGTTDDSRWKADLTEQLALVDSVIANLAQDRAAGRKNG